jgi:hypothetical protein
MSLDTARCNLSRCLSDPVYVGTLVTDWANASKVITAWWDAYKQWEREDSLEAAFNDHRLTTRYYKREFDAQLDMKAKEGFGGAQKDFPGHKVYVGLKGLAEYTKPDNFVPAREGMTARKIELGLYDQSARLLDGRKDISVQVFGKIEDGHRYAFMPLSDPDDQVVFHKLNEIGKSLRKKNEAFYALVRDIRSKMTRIKLAQDTDMGTNFTAVAPDDPVNPKFKYGISPTTTLPGMVLAKTFTKEQAAEILASRQIAAMNFKQILLAEKGNEITVAYRQHAGVFPLIGVWKASENCFHQYKIEGGELVRIEGATIPNRPPRAGT